MFIFAKRCTFCFRRAMSTIETFKGKEDRFKGITVESSVENVSSDDLGQVLQKSLEVWREKKVRSVWFKVQLSDSSWIPELTKQGFELHHANPPNQIAFLKWLPESVDNPVPSFAHHMIGVGGFVVNDKNEILVVSERYRYRSHWKLPGGYVDPEEHLGEAATREVLEETGIKTEFSHILGFRHGHKMNFDCSDIYFIVCLKPLNEDIKICLREISDSKWMPIREYIDHELVHDMNKKFARKYLEGKDRNRVIGLSKIDLRIKDVGIQWVYTIEDKTQK